MCVKLVWYWLASSPDGLVFDQSDSRKVGLTEMKCPKLKCYYTSQEIFEDTKFYVHYDDGKL